MTRRLIHLLNQRYRQQWQRAEHLQADLARRSWFGPFRAWLRSIWRTVFPFREPQIVPGVDEFLHADATPAGNVSIIIPFRDQAGLLRNCLRSLDRSTYPGREVVLVDNGSRGRRLLRWLGQLHDAGKARVVRDPAPFNFSRLCNTGAAAARGEWLLFLNNDTEILAPDWLEHMLALGGRDDVAITGAGLYYPDGTLQHLGACPDTAGRWVHPHRGMLAEEVNRHPVLARPRCAPAVTGACLLVRANRFHELGGFDESLPVEMNDIALCLRARARGWKVAVAPDARLLHYEGLSRGCGEDLPSGGGVGWPGSNSSVSA